MKQRSRGTCDIVNDQKFNVTLLRWKDKKAVTAVSTVLEKNQQGKQNATSKKEVKRNCCL